MKKLKERKILLKEQNECTAPNVGHFLVHDYVMEHLSEKEKDVFSFHAERCLSCQEEFAELVEILFALSLIEDELALDAAQMKSNQTPQTTINAAKAEDKECV